MVKAAAATLVVGLALLAPNVRAEGMSEGEKRIYAAGIVLASASGTINGKIQVRDASYAEFIPGWQTTSKVHIEQTTDCTYVEVIEGGRDLQSKDVKIDFSKLDGRWREDGVAIAFLGKDGAHCTRTIDNNVTCWRGMAYVPYSLRHAQLIDDVNFVLRHGCGASTDPDPY